MTTIPDGCTFKSPEQAIKILLQCSLFYLTDKDNALEFIEKSRNKLAVSDQVTKSQFTELTAWMYVGILKTFLQSPKDAKSNACFIKQIMQINKDAPVSQEFAQNLLENLQTERQLLELKFHEKTTTRVTITKIAYRYDISMIDETTPANTKPILVMDLLLSTGTRMVFRVSNAMFHKLRFTVARLLKEIQFLETRKIITR